MLKDPYDILGVASNATQSEIKRAYQRNAGALHPDRNPSPEAAERFNEVKQAFNLLSDEAQRRVFDDRRQKQLVEDPDHIARSIWKTYLNRAQL
jgi:curved DNA-binding protein CbpA